MTSCPGIKWIQVIQTGVDHLPLERLRERRLLVTCARGVYSAAVAEFALGLVYLFAKRYLVHYRLNQRRNGCRVWNDALSEQTMIVFGTGAIGAHVAQLARPSGMKIIGVNTDGHAVAGFDVVSAPTEIKAYCQEADYVINSLPLTRQTRG